MSEEELTFAVAVNDPLIITSHKILANKKNHCCCNFLVSSFNIYTTPTIIFNKFIAYAMESMFTYC